MSLSDDDWSEVLGHIRGRVREVGLADLDALVTLDFRSSDSPRVDFRRYLSSLLTAINERSYSGYAKALQTIQECVRTADGGKVDGIEIRVSDSDYSIYHTWNIDLKELTDLTPLISELEKLKQDLHDAELLDG